LGVIGIIWIRVKLNLTIDEATASALKNMQGGKVLLFQKKRHKKSQIPSLTFGIWDLYFWNFEP